MDTLAKMQTSRINAEEFFAGSGEMAALMRELDWSSTPLGPISEWPQSLKTSVSICLNSSFAILIWWGKELVMLYNDAYSQIVGNKHPQALGQTGRECWPEIWHIIGPMLHGVLETGQATRSDDLFLPLVRHGYPEECYFTFSYSPIRDESGGVGGVFTPVQETTEKIVGERRLRTLRDLAAQSIQTKEVEEVCRITVETLALNPYDIPFACLYLLEENRTTAHLAGAAGIQVESAICPQGIRWESIENEAPLQIFKQVVESGGSREINDAVALFGPLPTGAWTIPPKTVLVLPVTLPGNSQPSALLVAAVSPMKALDSAYRSFFDLVTGQVAASIAEARAYEEERRRAEALAELDRAKTTFFSNVSHEFRTPLTLMLAPVEDVLAAPEGEISPQNRDLLMVAHRNGMRLLKLVNTLLDFTRIEAGRIQASYVPTDLAAYTAELASVFRSAIEKAGMQLIVDCPPLSEPVYVDRDMWEKIVLNLLSNAFKFTLEGEVEVALKEGSDQVVLSIRDTGAGISAEQLPHIFERFHRVEGIRARTHEGTGIGLALVQELVKLHGGTVSVESAYGVGTTFNVAIPLGAAHLPQARIMAHTSLVSTALRTETFVDEALRWLPEASQAIVTTPYLTTIPAVEERLERGETQARILLADDNTDMREYVHRLLSSQYEVITVANGAEALRAIQGAQPDLVLSDVMMPELDGFGLLQALRADPHTASIPVILVSARAGEEARIEGLAAGADDYLTKPFTARELLARVSAHLELDRVRRQAEQAIRESEAQLQTLFDEAPVGIYLIDADFCIRQVNPAARPTFGDIPDLIGCNFADVMHILWSQEYAEEVIQFFRRTLETGEPYYMPERIEKRRDRGVLEYYEWQINRIPLPEGRYGVVCYFRDISKQVQARQEVEVLNTRLQQAMTETHHRVKNNLQLISALIDMQRNPSEKMVSVEEFTRLAANVRALSVIHDILTREAKAGSDQETLSVKSVLDELITGIEQTTGDRRLKASIDEARMVGRQTTTLALITNELVSNALKHGKGEMEISFRVEGDQATLEVCDDGPGFPPDFNAELAANTGLELVQNLVNWDLRGQITYGNRPQGGAHITIVFPIISHKAAANPVVQ